MRVRCRGDLAGKQPCNNNAIYICHALTQTPQGHAVKGGVVCRYDSNPFANKHRLTYSNLSSAEEQLLSTTMLLMQT